MQRSKPSNGSKPVIFINIYVGFFVVLAAALYSLWPLGYILDPAVERHSLASELQAPHHPYYWVFILSDVLAGLIVSAIGVYQLKRFHFRHGRAVAACIIGFGLLVALAAVTPLRCDPTVMSCGPLFHSPVILVHGFASVASVIMLFIALVISLQAIRQKRLATPLSQALVALLFCWFVFAFGSVLEYMYRIRGNQLQDFFITVCSLSILLVVLSNELVMGRLSAVTIRSPHK